MTIITQIETNLIWKVLPQLTISYKQCFCVIVLVMLQLRYGNNCV